MLSIYDRYVIRQFLVTFAFTLGLFSLISIFIDISEKIDDFIRHKPPIHVLIFDYYFYFLLWFFGQFGAIFVFLSCVFLNAMLAQNTEIIAVLSSGTNFSRFLRPYFIGALVLVTIFITLNTWLIPIGDKHRLAFEDQWVHDKVQTASQNIHAQIEPGTMLYIESFNYVDSTGTGLTLERFENSRIVQRIFANRLIWSKDNNMWRFENYQQRVFTNEGEVVTRGSTKDTMLPLRPSEFIVKTQYIPSMTNGELNEYIRKQRENGSARISALYVELYKRTASAIAFFPLTLLAVGVSSRKVRGGIGVHLGLGLMITLSYLLLIQVFKTFGDSNVLSPAMAVWTPVVLIALVASWITYRAPK